MTEIQSPPEQRVLLTNVSWETYERLLAEHPDSASPRFAYDRGMLEISAYGGTHEFFNRLLAQVIEVVTEELDIEVRSLGSMTLKREPDSCFYIQNEEVVRGTADVPPDMGPPPDLIIEVDIPSPSLSRFPIYAGFGVPRYGATTGNSSRFLPCWMENTSRPRPALPCRRSRPPR